MTGEPDAPVKVPPELVEAVRRALIHVAARGGTIAYKDLAEAAGVAKPYSIHKTTLALEALAAADHAAGRPLLSAVAVSKSGRPRPGFFQLLADLGRYDGPDRGLEADAVHDAELAQVHAAWAGRNGQPV